jgi:hypothetical protein
VMVQEKIRAFRRKLASADGDDAKQGKP